MAKNVFTHKFSEPLGSITTARVDIDAGDGNLTIDRLDGGEQVLAGGALQYLENQGQPNHSVSTGSCQAAFTLRAGRGKQQWLRLPWAACNGATEWRVHLNPTVRLELTAHTAGGNVRLDLSGMILSSVSADTGGGNMDLVLPENVTNLSVIAKSGAGNVTIRLPNGIPVRIHATSGLGQVIVDPCFQKVDKHTYQSPSFDSAPRRVEITASTGAGNVTVNLYESREPAVYFVGGL